MKYIKSLNENKVRYKTPAENRKILRSYVDIIKNSPKHNNQDIYYKYVIIIHNFLHLEEKFIDEIKLNNKEINRFLDLSPSVEYIEIIEKIEEYYNNSSKVRFGIETLDSIEAVRLYIIKLSENKKIDIYNKLYLKL